MAPSRGFLATILGALAGLLCVFVTDPTGPVLGATANSKEVVILLPPAGDLAGRPVLVTGAAAISAEGWTVHSWQDCPLTGSSGCHICVATASEAATVEEQFGYQNSPGLPSCPRRRPEAAPAPLPEAAPLPPAPAPPGPALEMKPGPTTKKPSTTKPPAYVLNAGKDGLPIADGKRPSWLVKEDELIIDARQAGHGGILIVQPVLMDASSTWGNRKAARPRWLRAILATNRHHARLHGHCVILRWQPTQPQLTKWQRRGCVKMDEKTCTRNNERENFNWEKHLMLYEYLISPQNFTHVLMLDADAALVKHSLDILGNIAKDMEKRNLDVFLTSEDWLLNGENRINGGFLMTRNSEWSQHLFQDTFRAHVVGPGGLRRWRIGIEHQECSSNEQICLNDIMSGSNKEHVKGHMSLESGVIYNRGGCTVKHCGEPITDPKMEALGMKDERLQVLHFMGGSKGLAPLVLCDGGKDYTGDGPKGYGCHK